MIASALAITLTLLAGCSTTQPGRATAAGTTTGASSTSTSSPSSSSGSSGSSGSSSSASSTSSSASVDVGDYPTTPAILAPTAGSEGSGRIFEGARLAEYVVVPTFVLADYTELSSFSTYIIKDGTSSSNVLGDEAAEILEQSGMIAGFTSARQTLPDSVGRSRFLLNTVLSFGSPEDAAAAAAAMNELVGAVQGGADTLQVPGYDASVVAHAISGINAGRAQVNLARGSLVLHAETAANGDSVEAMVQVLAALLNAQIPLSDTFVPTPLDQVSRLPADREGMLAHTLLSPEDYVNVNKAFGIKAMKHFFQNPLLDESAIVAAGVDLVGRGLTTVYRATDAAGAQLVADEFWEQYENTFEGLADYTGNSGVEGLRCKGTDGEQIACVFTVGRYIVEAHSVEDNSGADLDAIVTAQTALLTDF